MEHGINYESLLVISVLAFFSPIIINSIKKVNIPFVVGEIFVGLIFGKSFLNLIHEDVWLVFLSNLGLAYLMFLSGLEIDFNQLTAKDAEGKNSTKKKLLICTAMVFLSLLVSFGISIFFVQIGVIKNVYMSTFLLTATAPGFVVPFLKEKGLLDTEYGQTLLIFNLMCEFICLIAITVLSSLVDSGLSYKNFLFMILLLVSYLIYRLLKKSLKRINFNVEEYSGLHIEVRAAFALMIILVSLSSTLGTEIVMGAFLAGVIFSLISGYNRENLTEKMDIIGYGFLIPIFFIQLGANLDIKQVYAKPSLIIYIPILLIALYLVKAISSLLLIVLFGVNKSISAGVILASQLSLMIVGSKIANSLHLISNSMYVIFIITTILSCFIFPLIFNKVLKLDGIEKKMMSHLNKICVREKILTNESIIDKPLKETTLPPSCRILMIQRNEQEILPNGETILRKGDLLLLAGIKQYEEEMLLMATKTNYHWNTDDQKKKSL